MKIAAIIAVFGAAIVLCSHSELIAGFAPFISLGLIAVSGKILES